VRLNLSNHNFRQRRHFVGREDRFFLRMVDDDCSLNKQMMQLMGAKNIHGDCGGLQNIINCLF
jgi:hypothetical protein